MKRFEALEENKKFSNPMTLKRVASDLDYLNKVSDIRDFVVSTNMMMCLKT